MTNTKSHLSEESIELSARLVNLTHSNSDYTDHDRIEITINGQRFHQSFYTNYKIGEVRWRKFAQAMRWLTESVARYAENGAIGKCEHCGRPLND